MQQFDWRLKGKYREAFASHFTQVFVSMEQGIFLIGGHGNTNNNLHYDTRTIKVKANLP